MTLGCCSLWSSWLLPCTAGHAQHGDAPRGPSPSSAALCLPAQLPPVQCPGHAKERNTRAYPSSSTCVHVACLAVAQKVPSSVWEECAMLHLWGRGMHGGRLTSTKCIYSCLGYDARETSDSGLVLWKHSVRQLTLLCLGLVYWQSRYEIRNEHRAAFLSNSQESSTRIVAAGWEGDQRSLPLQDLPLASVRWHPGLLSCSALWPGGFQLTSTALWQSWNSNLTVAGDAMAVAWLRKR